MPRPTHIGSATSMGAGGCGGAGGVWLLGCLDGGADHPRWSNPNVPYQAVVRHRLSRLWKYADAVCPPAWRSPSGSTFQRSRATCRGVSALGVRGLDLRPADRQASLELAAPQVVGVRDADSDHAVGCHTQHPDRTVSAAPRLVSSRLAGQVACEAVGLTLRQPPSSAAASRALIHTSDFQRRNQNRVPVGTCSGCGIRSQAE